MMLLYQILDVVSDAIPSEPVNYGVSAVGKTTSYTGAYGTAFPLQAYLWKSKDSKLRGQLRNNQRYTASQAVQRLKAQIGRALDSIWIYPIELEGGQTEPLWMYSLALLHDVDDKTGKGGRTEIDLKLEIDSTFIPVNPLFWRYSAHLNEQIEITNDSAQSLAESLSWPSTVELRQSPSGFAWLRNRLSYKPMLNPDNWQYILKYLPAWYPQAGVHQPWTNNYRRFVIWPDSSIFGFAPLSVYAFKDVPASGTLFIETLSRDMALMDNVSNTVSIDCATVHAALSAISETWQTGDVLLVGEFLGAAAIVRNGLILAYCFDAMSNYTTQYPGQLSAAENYVQVQSLTGQWSALWIFRSV